MGQKGVQKATKNGEKWVILDPLKITDFGSSTVSVVGSFENPVLDHPEKNHFFWVGLLNS